MYNDYARKGKNYETFICKAYNCNKGCRHGANANFLKKAFTLENFERQNSLEYKKSIHKLKIHIEKALCKLKKRKKYFNSQDEFMPLLLRLKKATCAEDLSKTANLGLAKIIECENRLRESG